MSKLKRQLKEFGLEKTFVFAYLNEKYPRKQVKITPIVSLNTPLMEKKDRVYYYGSVAFNAYLDDVLIHTHLYGVREVLFDRTSGGHYNFQGYKIEII